MPELWDDSIPNKLAEHAQKVFEGIFTDGAKEALGKFDLDVDWELIEPKAVEYAQARGAELVGKKFVNGELVANPAAEWAVEETTRSTARLLLDEAVREGWSYADFAERLDASGLFGEARAQMIARTELAIAEARGHSEAFRQAGVTRVVIYDEDECGEDVCDVDGEEWDLDEYEANPIGHPNCTRAARPITQEEQEAS